MSTQPINPTRETPYTISLTHNEMVCLVKYHTAQAKAMPKKVGAISMKLADENRGIPRRRDLAALHAEASDVLQYHTSRARGILSIIQPKKG